MVPAVDVAASPSLNACVMLVGLSIQFIHLTP